MNTRKLALGGVMAALATLVMLLGGLIGIGTYAAPFLAGILLIPIGQRLGRLWHLLVFAAVGILSFILVPDVEESLVYAAFFGWYPILRPFLERLPVVLRYVVKLLLFNLCIIAAEALLMLVLVPATETGWLLIALLILGNVVFLLYDRLLPRMTNLLSALLKRIGA